MFRRFVEWIDSFDDRINPIAVRDLRRLHRNHLFEILLLLALFGLFLFFGGVALFSKYDEFEFLENAFPIVSMMVGCIGIAFSMLASMNSLAISGKDELLDATSLTPGRILHGNMLTLLILSIFSISIVLPFFAVSFYYKTDRAFYLLLSLLGCSVLAQVFNLVVVAFFARAKSGGRQILTFFLMMYPVTLCLEIPWFVLFFLWDYLGVGPPSPSIFNLILLWVGLVSVLILTAMISYRLAVYQIRHRNGNFWKGIFVCLAVYFVLSSFCAAVFGLVVPFL